MIENRTHFSSGETLKPSEPVRCPPGYSKYAIHCEVANSKKPLRRYRPVAPTAK